MTGTALTMQVQLAQLAKRHGIAPPQQQHVEPALPECDGPQVLSGYASVPIVDHHRMLFRKHSLSWLDWQMPPLLLRHGAEVIGTVDQLEWTDKGLAVSVTTAHPQAKLCAAFSITATVNAYVLRDVDGPRFFAEVTSAWLESVSLTSSPACPAALVGSAFVLNALIETERVFLLAGEPVPVGVPTDSGRPHHIFRCPACQTAVWSEYGGAAKLRFVRVGTLDQPAAVMPDVHIYVRSKLAWVSLPAGVSAFEAYYDARKLWPAASLERRRAVLR
jgi:hypothetical protein